MDIDTTIFIAMAIVFVGSFVQSAIGFGLAIIAAPILFPIAPEYVPGPISVTAFVLASLNAFKHKESIAIGGLKVALIGRIPGSILGAMLLLYVSTQTLSLWLGILVLIALLISLLPFRIEPTPIRMAVAGLLSGFMGTSSGIGGPPMALLLQHQEANALRGNLSAFFMCSSLISIAVLIAVGHFTVQHLLISLPLIPAVWAGYRCALLSMHYISRMWLRSGALMLCLISGISAIYQGIS